MQMAFDDRVHIAELVALLGPPPPEFRERCNLSYVFWDENGIHLRFSASWLIDIN